jgi:hypothetical protein
MHSRWFNAAVIGLWLATMSWLVKEKVLPPLLAGDPPSYSQIIEAQKDAPPVGWRMSLSGRTIGWALNDTKPQQTGLTDIHGRVHFDALPLDEMMPSWLRTFSRLLGQSSNHMEMDARSVLTIDPLGHLVRFDSTVHADPLSEAVSVRGTVDGQQLQLTVRTGNASFTNEAFLPNDALLSDALSPQTQLPGLRAGQKWTVPVYSPLWPAKNPLEIIQAEVEGTEPVFWNQTVEECWLVVYRSDAGSTNSSHAPRGMLWVRRDGTVLRQQILLFDTIIRFDRMTDPEAVKLASSVGVEWWSAESTVRNTPGWDGKSLVVPTVSRRVGPRRHFHPAPQPSPAKDSRSNVHD